MRPFLPLSLPQVPTYTELVSLLSPASTEKTHGHDSSFGKGGFNEQALSMLEAADQSFKLARKEWEAINKANAETARCSGCEDWWRAGVKNVLRACIAGNIAVATAKKAVTNAGGRDVKDIVKAEVMESGQDYHTWWRVPRISTK